MIKQGDNQYVLTKLIEALKVSHTEIGSKEHRLTMISMLIGSIISFAIMYSPQPLISVFSQEYNIPPSTASFSISLTTLSLGFSLLFVSILSNTWGRKKTMCLSLLLTSVLAIVSSFGHNFYFFLFIRFLEGISIAGFPSVAIAYLNEEFHPSAIGSVIGAYVAGTAIGGFVGRVVIGALTDLSSWQTAIMVLGIISLLGSMWFWENLPQSKNAHAGTSSIKQWSLNVIGCFRDKSLICLYSVGFLMMGAYIALLNYIGYPLTKPPYNLSQTIFGFLFVVNLIGTVSSLWFGKLADKYHRSHVICWAIAIFVIGAILTLQSLLISKVIGVMLVAFGFFAAHAVASGWIGLLAPRKHRSQASSFYLLFFYTGSGLIGWSGGFFLNSFGWTGLICYICSLAAIAAITATQTEKTDEILFINPTKVLFKTMPLNGKNV